MTTIYVPRAAGNVLILHITPPPPPPSNAVVKVRSGIAQLKVRNP